MSFSALGGKIRDISGNTTSEAGDILLGESAFSKGVEITGTMPNRGAISITPGTTSKVIPEGYHNGAGSVEGDSDLVSANIRSGANIFNVAGNSAVVNTSDGTAVDGDVLSGKTGYVNGSKVTGTMTDRGTVNITPSTANQTIQAGRHSGSGVVFGDSDLVSANIRSGANIFNVAGNSAVVNTSDATATAGYCIRQDGVC